jgi:hypothetical protein
MEVLLQKDIEKLGRMGDVVNVADGYARNYLLPRRIAVVVTADNLRAIEKAREARRVREVEEIERVRQLRAGRSETSWHDAIDKVTAAARDGRNLLPPVIDAVEAKATIGEISDALRAAFGEYRERRSRFCAKGFGRPSRWMWTRPKLRRQLPARSTYPTPSRRHNSAAAGET